MTLDRISLFNILIKLLTFNQTLIPYPQYEITFFVITYLSDFINTYTRICSRFF